MLEREARHINAVVIAAPDHVHMPARVMAMRMGMHVYCEKPLGQNVTEVRLAAQVARRAGVVTQMGNGAHTGYNYRSVAKMIRDGVMSALLGRTRMGKLDRGVTSSAQSRPSSTHHCRL